MDPAATLKQLLSAAVQFEAKAPRQQRIEGERRALLEAITQAQLVLSVRRTGPIEKDRPAEAAGNNRQTTLRGISGGLVDKRKPSGRPRKK